MNTAILTQKEQIVKWVVAIDATTDLTGVPDGAYPFNGLTDQWAVVIGEQAVNWSSTYGAACLMHIEAMRVNREHVTRNPSTLRQAQDETSSGHSPANGLGAWWTVRTAEFTASVDRETGEVRYEDA